MHADEERLLKRAQRGNVRAFETLVHRYDARVATVILRLVDDPEDAQDLHQEAFLRAYQSLPSFRL